MTLRRSDILLVALATKLAFMVAIWVLSVDSGKGGLSPFDLGGDDGVVYSRISAYIVEHGGAPAFSLDSNLWPVGVGYLSLWSGVDHIIVYKLVQMISSVGMVLVCISMGRIVLGQIGLINYSKTSYSILVLALCFLPSILFFGSISLYRDQFLYFTFALSILSLLRYFISHSSVWIITFVVALVLLASVRWYAALAVMGGSLMFTVDRLRDSRRKKLVYLAVIVLVVAGGLAVASWIDLFGKYDKYVNTRSYFEKSDAGSNLGIDYANQPYWKLPILYSYSLISNVFGPLPFQVSGISTLVGALVEAPVVIIAFFIVYKGPSRHTAAGKICMYCALSWFLLIAVYNDNLGTALRLRVLGSQLIFVLAACDASYRYYKLKSIRIRNISVRYDKLHHMMIDG